MTYEKITKVIRGFLRLIYRIDAEGMENVPKTGGVIFAPNHKSNWDPVILAAYCPRKLSFMAKAELFKFAPLGSFFKKIGAIPVKRGKGDIGAVKASLEILKGQNAMAMYPEGTRNNDTVEHAKQGIVMLATHSCVPIVPVYVSGKYKLFGKLTIAFGKPIELREYYKAKIDRDKQQELADDILHEIRKLKK